MREHEVEPVPGLPERLPTGEGILWQGSPAWWSLAQRAMHLRVLGAYFLLMVAWSMATALSSDAPPAEVALACASSVGLALFCLGLLAFIGRLAAKASVYTITTERVVLRVGVALPMTINIPFVAIASAAVKRHADGTEDIVLSLVPEQRISWLALWPHVRPWRLGRAEPMLRSLPVAAGAAQVLARALAASASMPVSAIASEAPRGKSPVLDGAVA